MARYGLATILQPHPVGLEFKANELPLHLTLIDSFEIEMPLDELSLKLGALLRTLNAFQIQTTADEQFGPDHDIPVTAVALNPELKLMHESLVEFIIQHRGTLRYPESNGPNYSPHISIYDSRRIAVGDQILINDVSLAAKLADDPEAPRVILANFQLA